MTISSFQGDYRFLSNFWYIPGGILLNDEYATEQSREWQYPTVEHAYVAAKTIDISERYKVTMINKPGDVKRYGRSLALRRDWEAVKFDIMLDLLRQKFEVPDLRRKLLDTGNHVLIEGNSWHDNIWGVCSCYNCSVKYDAIMGNTEGNMLGKLLMKVRDEIKS